MIGLLLAMQLSMESGLVNYGQLATELTHRLRATSMPGSVYVGAAIDFPLSKHFALTIGATVNNTILQRTKCADECVPASRDYRPMRPDSMVGEYHATVTTPRIGIRARHRFASLTAFVSAPIIETNYSLVGASPMLVRAFGVEPELRVKHGGIYARFTFIPPQCARFTAFSEATGHKQNGHGGKCWKDDLWIRPIELGARLYVH